MLARYIDTAPEVRGGLHHSNEDSEDHKFQFFGFLSFFCSGMGETFGFMAAGGIG